MNEWNFVNLKDWKIYYPMYYEKKTNSIYELRLIKMFLHCFDEKSQGEVSLCNILFKLWFEFWCTKIFFNSFFFLEIFFKFSKRETNNIVTKLSWLSWILFYHWKCQKKSGSYEFWAICLLVNQPKQGPTVL